MKKTLIALAAVVSVTAVSAQNVTLFGRLDASVAKTSTKVDGVKDQAKSQTGVNSSNLNTQFWGLRGSEDLGGGLKAEFMLQSNFNIDNGAVDSNGMFSREAWVGLSGGFGAVKLGRNYTAYDNLAGAVNHTMNSNINVTGAVHGAGIAQYDTRVNNSIHYSSPSMNGVSGSISYGFGENKTATQSADKNTSFQVRYADGPLMVGAGYMKQTSQTADSDRKHTLFGGSYDLGAAKLTGSYQTSKQGALKDKEYQIGVSVPVGNVTVAFGYADSESKNATVKRNSDGYALVAVYSLSKRTSVYAGYETSKVESAPGTTKTETKATNMAFGVRHTF